MVKNRKILTYILIVLIVTIAVPGIIFASNNKQEMSRWKEPEDSIMLTPNNEADRQAYEDGEVKLNFQEKQQLWNLQRQDTGRPHRRSGCRLQF